MEKDEDGRLRLSDNGRIKRLYVETVRSLFYGRDFFQGQTCADGLSSQEVRKRLQTFGRNEIRVGRVHWQTILIRRFLSPFFYLLAGAALVALFLGERAKAVFIVAFVLKMDSFLFSFLAFQFRSFRQTGLWPVF